MENKSSSKINKLLRDLEIEWELRERLSAAELGNSPGDISWREEKLLIEKTCPPEWVVHEVAHYLVCKRLSPEKLQEQNWGLVSNCNWSKQCESIASSLTCALLIRLEMNWHSTAVELGLMDDRLIKNEYLWEEAKNEIERESREYLVFSGLSYLTP